MAADYYGLEPRAESEAVERWENEGGKSRRNHRYTFDSVGKNYRRQIERELPVVDTLHQQKDVARAKWPLLPKRRSISARQQPVLDGGSTFAEALAG